MKNFIIGNRFFEPDAPTGTTPAVIPPVPGPLENDFSKPQTVDDYDAILNELDEGSSLAPVIASTVDTPKTDTAKLDEQIEEAGNKIATDPNAATPETTPPVEAPKTDTPPVTGNGLVTDEFLATLSEDERKYVEKFKGQPIAELVKSFANQAKLLGKKKEELIPVTKPVTTPEGTPQVPQTNASTTDSPKTKQQQFRQQWRKRNNTAKTWTMCSRESSGTVTRAIPANALPTIRCAPAANAAWQSPRLKKPSCGSAWT